jgi:tetratricopeptide (TPR) repeat protein
MILLLSLWLAAPPDVLSEQAVQLAGQRRYEEAAGLWTQALQASPGHFPSLFNFGVMEFRRERFPEAAALLERAARVQPRDFNTRYMLGTALLRTGAREEALRQWRAALAIQPDNARLMQVMSVEYNNGLYFAEACEVGQRSARLPGALEQAYLIAIKACIDAQSPGAFALASEAVQRFPSSARANFELGFQLQRNGRRDEALPYLEKAIQLDAAYEEPLFFLGDLLLLDDRPAEAAALFRRALLIRPDYMPACISLGKALLAQRQPEEAVRALGRCVEAKPDHPQPHLLLSQAWYRLGDEGRAREEKDLSLRLRRENPSLMEAPQARVFPSAQKVSRSPVNKSPR